MKVTYTRLTYRQLQSEHLRWIVWGPERAAERTWGCCLRETGSTQDSCYHSVSKCKSPLGATVQKSPSSSSWSWKEKLKHFWKHILVSILSVSHLFETPWTIASVHGILQARILEWVAISLLQGIFLTQGSNLGLPHCKQILYHLSHKGSPHLS